MALGPSLILIDPLNLVKFTVAVLTTIASPISPSAPLLDDIRIRTSVGIPQTNSGNISITAPLTSPPHLNLPRLHRNKMKMKLPAPLPLSLNKLSLLFHKFHMLIPQLLRALDRLTKFHINSHLFKSLVASLKALDLPPLYQVPLESFLQLSLLHVPLLLLRHQHSHLPHRPVLQPLPHQHPPVLQSLHPLHLPKHLVVHQNLLMANPLMHKPSGMPWKIITTSMGTTLPQNIRRSPLPSPTSALALLPVSGPKIVKKLPLAKPLLTSVCGPISKLPLKSTLSLSSPLILPSKICST